MRSGVQLRRWAARLFAWCAPRAVLVLQAVRHGADAPRCFAQLGVDATQTKELGRYFALDKVRFTLAYVVAQPVS